MKKNILLIVVVLLGIFLGSCDREEKYQQKMVGEWKITKAKKGLFGGNDLLHRWKMIELTFNSDGSMLWMNHESQVRENGTFLVEKERYTDGNGATQVNFYVDMNITDTSGYVRNEYWRVNFVRKEKMKLVVEGRSERDDLELTLERK